jgi:hydroxymethylglutaryl-CoA lyase
MNDVQSIEIVEVSARDGLQNESRLFTTEEKLDLIRQSIEAGVRRLEVASFVHPKRVPQMADAEAVIAGLTKRDDVTYIGLIMNERGLDRALETQIDEIGCVTVATDTFAQKNQGQTSDGSVEIAKQLIRRAKSNGLRANVTISAAFGCPFEGEVSTARIVNMAKALAEAEPHEIAIADTIGVGQPWQAEDIFNAVRAALPHMPLRAHFHNTRNTGIANAYAAVRAGVTTLDGSIGGIGGCPFAPSATGNVPTEDVVYMLERRGIETGLSLDKLNGAAHWLTEKMDRVLPGMVSRAGGFPKPNIQNAAE